jgi:hypothetical protein
MRMILIKRLDKIYNDIIEYYIHNEDLQDEDIDDDIRDILDRIDELQNKIDYTL